MKTIKVRIKNEIIELKEHQYIINYDIEIFTSYTVYSFEEVKRDSSLHILPLSGDVFIVERDYLEQIEWELDSLYQAKEKLEDVYEVSCADFDRSAKDMIKEIIKMTYKVIECYDGKIIQ